MYLNNVLCAVMVMVNMLMVVTIISLQDKYHCPTVMSKWPTVFSILVNDHHCGKLPCQQCVCW
jgi:hypothetical protein